MKINQCHGTEPDHLLAFFVIERRDERKEKSETPAGVDTMKLEVTAKKRAYPLDIVKKLAFARKE
jgi:hypothetical protein